MPMRGILKDGGIFVCQNARRKKYSQFLLSNTFNVYNLRVLEYFDT